MNEFHLFPTDFYLFNTAAVEENLSEIHQTIHHDLEELHSPSKSPSSQKKQTSSDELNKTPSLHPHLPPRTRWTHQKQNTLPNTKVQVNLLRDHLKQLSTRLKQIKEIVHETQSKPLDRSKREQLKSITHLLQHQRQAAKEIGRQVANLGETLLSDSLSELQTSAEGLTQAMKEITPLVLTGEGGAETSRTIQQLSTKVEGIKKRISKKTSLEPLPQIKKNFDQIFKVMEKPGRGGHLTNQQHGTLYRSFHKLESIVKKEFQEIRAMSKMLETEGEENSLKEQKLLQERLIEFSKCLGLMKGQIEKARAVIPDEDLPFVVKLHEDIKKMEVEYKAEQVNADADSGSDGGGGERGR